MERFALNRALTVAEQADHHAQGALAALDVDGEAALVVLAAHRARQAIAVIMSKSMDFSAIPSAGLGSITSGAAYAPQTAQAATKILVSRAQNLRTVEVPEEFRHLAVKGRN